MKLQKISSLLIFLILSCSPSSKNIATNSDINLTQTSQIDGTFNEAKSEKGFNHFYFSFQDCKSFLGPNNPPECMNPPNILSQFNYETSISNVVKFNELFFVLLQEGKIFIHNFKNQNSTLFLDISDKVQFSGLETGLLSVAFSPIHTDFLVSYINDSGYLTFELYEYSNDIFNIINSKVIYQDIANNKENYGTHYGGKVIWSNYFNDYLISLGDFHEGNASSRLNSDPQDFSSLKGKILITNIHSDTSFKNIYELENNIESKSLQNIVAFGLRNPWQFFETGNFLIIFDTGLSQNEELNILNLKDNQINFGWPIFEGPSLSEDIDKIKNYNLDVNFKTKGLSLTDFISSSSQQPNFYYNHHPCDAVKIFGLRKNCEGYSDQYKAAIIGGDILLNSFSEYNFDIFFADYLSEELFSFNLTNGNIKIYPIPGINQITSVSVFNNLENQIILSNTIGELFILQIDS